MIITPVKGSQIHTSEPDSLKGPNRFTLAKYIDLPVLLYKDKFVHFYCLFSPKPLDKMKKNIYESCEKINKLAGLFLWESAKMNKLTQNLANPVWVNQYHFIKSARLVFTVGHKLERPVK